MSTNYTSLLTVLKEDDSAKVSSLLQNITKYKFLHVLHFLLDALQKMAYLCKLYQSSSITFVDVEAPLRSSIKFIASLEKENRGEKLGSFSNPFQVPLRILKPRAKLHVVRLILYMMATESVIVRNRGLKQS